MARQIRIRKTRRTRFSALLSALMVLGLVAMMATPALAHHKADHTQGSASSGASRDGDGDADSDSSTAYTEDNDTNDGGTPNNVSDDGDNAHPSGKDRSVESGNSGNQGKSESNPDDSKGPMRYEGALGDDKPNGPGGTDLADQDGNNGCGNDDDFDDDNNGWCGKPKPSPAPSVAPVQVCPADTDHAGFPMTDLEDCNDDEVKVRIDKAGPKDRVLGKVIHRATPEVLNQRVTPAAQGAVLPFTGGAIATYVFAALGLLAAGIVALRIKK